MEAQCQTVSLADDPQWSYFARFHSQQICTRTFSSHTEAGQSSLMDFHAARLPKAMSDHLVISFNTQTLLIKTMESTVKPFQPCQTGTAPTLNALPHFKSSKIWGSAKMLSET